MDIRRTKHTVRIAVIGGLLVLSIGAAVSAASTELGKRLFPIPFLGPIIGNAFGTFLYKSASLQ